MEKSKVTIYTDGACSGNPGPGGYAAVIMYGDNFKEISGSEKDTTNNRMELMAAIKALTELKKPCIVELHSDSAYLVNAYENRWVEGWKKNNWKTSSKQAVKNVDLWTELETLRGIHDVSFIKVKGHADNKYNNRCDELAVNAIKNISVDEGENQTDESEENDKIMQVFGTLPTLSTERLDLRLFNENDAADLFEYCSDPEVTRFLLFPTYTSIQTAVDRIKYCKDCYTNITKAIPWAIADKKTGKLIGGIDFVKWSIKDNAAEVGYVLNRKYWNQGITTEALAEVIKFGFEKMGLNRIVICCDERNIASARVMEKNELQYEGTLREEKLIKGEYCNIKYYSILRSEYMKK